MEGTALPPAVVSPPHGAAGGGTSASPSVPSGLWRPALAARCSPLTDRQTDGEIDRHEVPGSSRRQSWPRAGYRPRADGRPSHRPGLSQAQARVRGDKVGLPPHSPRLGCGGKQTAGTPSPAVCGPAGAHFEAQLLQVYIILRAFHASECSLCFSAAFKNKAHQIHSAACLHPVAVERGWTHPPAKPSSGNELKGAERWRPRPLPPQLGWVPGTKSRCTSAHKATGAALVLRANDTETFFQQQWLAPSRRQPHLERVGGSLLWPPKGEEAAQHTRMFYYSVWNAERAPAMQNMKKETFLIQTLLFISLYNEL